MRYHQGILLPDDTFNTHINYEGTMAAHRTRVLKLKGNAHVGTCTCGWTSSDQARHSDASELANEHFVSAVRGETLAPKKA